MANNNVLFKVGTSAQFNALAIKDDFTLYWLTDTKQLFKGSVLYGTGAIASEVAAGLLSAEDYVELKKLIAAGPSSTLQPVDGSLSITDGKIGVQISNETGNLIAVNSDGLFATVDLQPIEQRLTAVEAQIVGGIRYKGSVPTVEDLPTDAAQGDLYEVEADGSEYCYNGEKWFEYGSAHFEPVAGQGINVNGSEISVKIAENSNGLTVVNGSMTMLLATKDNDGAMSKEDKKALDVIPYVYEAKKYEITGAPVGTLVNYREDEIRIMCPINTEWTTQNVGAGGDANKYYVTLNTYAPNDAAVGYMEDLGGGVVDTEILTDLKIDEYGRRYQPSWFGVAKMNDDGTWNYYGKNSSNEHMVGWDYKIDWFNSDGVKISTDSIRINLSNEDCHNNIASASVQKVTNELEAVKAELETAQESYSWGEI